MAKEIDMTQTFYRKAGLPLGLQAEPEFELKSEVIDLCTAIEQGTYTHSIIVFQGLKPGKTVSAAAVLRAWIKQRKGVVDASTPGIFLSVHQLCYQNRSIDRYQRDEALQQALSTAKNTDFLVLDGLFSYITQNDDLMLQALYDSRQHSCKTTLVTTNIEDPLECAGSILYRICRDADVKVVF